MKKRILLGVADQSLIGELASRIEALDDFEIIQISESTQDLASAVLNHSPDLLIIDRDLPPGPISRVTHDLATRRPALPILLAARSQSEDSLALALDIGARGVITAPFVLAELNDAMLRGLEWSERMLGLLAGGGTPTTTQGGIAVFAGSKGGVGTSVITAHTAWLLAKEQPELKICLVDLDLEKGDVPSFIDLSYRVSIVDLAKIADDITDRVVRDTVAVHESGLHILPAPTDVRDSDAVTASSVRSILAQLRQMYDIVLVDGGSNVTPSQSAAVEMADHTVQVVTTDVPSLRAARRQTEAWTKLGVASAADVRVLVNRYSRNAEIQQSTIDRLVLGHRMDVMIPDLERGLEGAVNTRTPSHGSPKIWWKSLRAMLAEAEILAATGEPERSGWLRRTRRGGPGRDDRDTSARQGDGGSDPHPLPPPAGVGQDLAGTPLEDAGDGRRARVRSDREAGQATIETVGVFPITVICVLLLWQLVGLGLSFLWAGHAANAAAREAALGSSQVQVVRAAQDAVPSAIQDQLTVSTSGNDVTVRLKLAPWGAGVAETPIGVDRTVVKEPRP